MNSASRLLIHSAMSTGGLAEVAQTLVCDLPNVGSQTEVCATVPAFSDRFIAGIKRRWTREQRRRKVGRAYDMALEITRIISKGSAVLDVGCGNGYIAHHLSAMLGTKVVGIDVNNTTEALIDYRPYDGKSFPIADDSVDAVLLCYVLHHAQDARLVLSEVRRVLRDGGTAVIYEDIPQTWWDQGVCWLHNRQWQKRTGPCTFLDESEWRALFEAFGFEISNTRTLSRTRNLTHPVARQFYWLTTGELAKQSPRLNLTPPATSFVHVRF